MGVPDRGGLRVGDTLAVSPGLQYPGVPRFSPEIFARVRLDESDKVDVLFACDDKRVAELAERAGRRYGVEVIAGSVEHVAYYLYQSALRLAPEAGEPVRTR